MFMLSTCNGERNITSATEKIGIQEKMKMYIVDILVPFSENGTHVEIMFLKRRKKENDYRRRE